MSNFTPAAAGWRVVVTYRGCDEQTMHDTMPVIGWLPNPPEENLPPSWSPIVFDSDLGLATARADAVRLTEEAYGAAVEVTLAPGQPFEADVAAERLGLIEARYRRPERRAS